MAISNPEQGVAYCEDTTGARIEWQTPDRDILFNEDNINEAIAEYYQAAEEAQKGTDAEDNPIAPPSPRALQELLESRYPWDGYTTADTNEVPLVYQVDEQVTNLVETLTVSPGDSVPTVNTLTKNKYYTFVTSGLLTLGGGIFADAIYRIDSNAEETEPSDLLTIDDEQFQNLYFNAARDGTPYDPFHVYSVGYVGNDAVVTFTLANQGSGLFQVDIYENEYRLRLASVPELIGNPESVFFDQTRDKPFLNLNIACGGSCPTRTSFACECAGTRSCYWDDQEGAITKIFEGSENG